MSPSVASWSSSTATPRRRRRSCCHRIHSAYRVFIRALAAIANCPPRCGLRSHNVTRCPRSLAQCGELGACRAAADHEHTL